MPNINMILHLSHLSRVFHHPMVMEAIPMSNFTMVTNLRMVPVFIMMPNTNLMANFTMVTCLTMVPTGPPTICCSTPSLAI